MSERGELVMRNTRPKHSRILKNQAKCLLCGDVVESKHPHDFVACSCGALTVDGGNEYLCRAFYNRLDWEERSILEEFGEAVTQRRNK